MNYLFITLKGYLREYRQTLQFHVMKKEWVTLCGSRVPRSEHVEQTNLNLLMSTTTEESLFSPVPFSPFSDAVSVSEPTSDEGPDLGQFNIVFRTLTDLHPHPCAHPFNPVHLTPDFTPVASSATEQEYSGTAATETRIQEVQTQTQASERQNGSTVWHQHPILSYLDYSPVGHTRTPSELIVAQYPYAPLGEHRFQEFMSTDEQREPSQTVGDDEEDDGNGSDDTEGGLTV
jgi:hypothetical protein